MKISRKCTVADAWGGLKPPRGSDGGELGHAALEHSPVALLPTNQRPDWPVCKYLPEHLHLSEVWQKLGDEHAR